MRAKRQKAVDRAPAQLGLALPQMKPDWELSPDEIAERIAFLERQISKTVTRIARLRRRRAAIIAGTASGPARIRVDAEAVRARYAELGAGRGTIKILATQFGCSSRTIHRALALRHER